MGRGSSGIGKTARYIVGQYSLTDITDSSGKIIDFYKYIDEHGGIRVEDGKIKIKKSASARAGELADELSDRMVMRDQQAERDYKNIKAEFSGTYTISKHDAADIPDFNAYKRSSDNFVRIGKRGTSIDSKYQELASKYPNYFDRRITSQSAQLERINTVLAGLKNSTKPFPNEWKIEAVADLKSDIIRGYVAAKRRKAA